MCVPRRIFCVGREARLGTRTKPCTFHSPRSTRYTYSMPKPNAPKLKTQYVCSNCHSVHMRWAGKCGDCGEWNTLIEEIVDERASVGSARVGSANALNAPQKLADIRPDDIKRIPLNIGEFSRVLGGGIVPGSLVLVGGDPGIGKSTLLMQSAVSIAKHSGTTLYVSGEESAQQLKMRAERLGVGDSELYLLTETNLDTVVHHIEQMKPKLTIIDSIQTM